MGAQGGPSSSSINGRVYFDQSGDGNFYANDGQRDFFRIGIRPDGSFGFDVAKPGENVRTAKDEQLTLSSRFNQLRIIVSGTLDLVRAPNATNGSVGVSVPPGAGAFIAYMSNPYDINNQTRVPLPFTDFWLQGSDAGKILSMVRANYNPLTGVIGFFAYASTVSDTFAAGDRYTIEYFLLSQTLA